MEKIEMMLRRTIYIGILLHSIAVVAIPRCRAWKFFNNETWLHGSTLPLEINIDSFDAGFNEVYLNRDWILN